MSHLFVFRLTTRNTSFNSVPAGYAKYSHNCTNKWIWSNDYSNHKYYLNCSGIITTSNITNGSSFSNLQIPQRATNLAKPSAHFTFTRKVQLLIPRLSIYQNHTYNFISRVPFSTTNSCWLWATTSAPTLLIATDKYKSW